ncbi:MAG: RNA polymerase sporulation sigma factor SigK [Clostridia bacterium]|nr:RNA polymerase sporulation sigma factor SigK [Clostridia bacterium]
MVIPVLFALLTRFLHISLGVGTQTHFPPPLTPEEEKACFLRAGEGDEAARERLIIHNLRLVSHIVRKYYGSNKNQEDLISVGSIGLIKAVDTFRVEDGTRFATYAAKCVQNEILMYFRKLKHRQREVSMGDTIDVDREGNPLTYMDVIASEENMTEDVDRKLCSARALRYVDIVLDERERQIIHLRYGLGGKEPLAQREVASLLGISRSYVSRLEKGALDKLHHAMTGGIE